MSKFTMENTSLKKRKISGSTWLWLLLGVTIGMLVYPLLFDDSSQKLAHEKNILDLKNSENLAGNNYDFYKLLSKSDINSNSSTLKKVDNKTLDLKSNNLPSNKYIIQAGSFSKLSEAEELKAKLALNGFPAQIKAVQIKDNTWYRIQLGPYDSKAIAKQKQARLEEQKIADSLIIKN